MAYPFGMLVPNRHGSSNAYRYGFQGQEKDDELKGEGNSLSYTFRMHDPRVGRFFAVDPLFKTYPWNSSYAFSENRVIDGVELEGLEHDWFMNLARAGVFGKPVQQIVNGVEKSVSKTVDGIAYVATNPKEALTGAGNFLLGATIKGTGMPVSVSTPFLQNIDQKFGTTTVAATQAFEQSISESANKLIHGNLEDKTEVVTDIVTAYFGDKGVGKLRILKRFNLAKQYNIATDFIDFSKKVYTTTLKKGDVLYQYRIPGTNEGSYFVKSLDITPAQVGIDPSDYTEIYKVTLDKDSKVLISTHKENTPYWRNPEKTLDGGGEQIYGESIKEKATFEKIN